MKYIAVIAYILTIPIANWLIGNVGTECIPSGPCLIPVGFGYSAPTGVLMIGAALVLRDAVQNYLGVRWTLAAITAGILLSAFVAPPALMLASAVAFGLAELADMAVYTPLKQKGMAITGILASGIVGSIIDSAVFLYIAFGSLQFIEGQVIGKIEMTLLAVAGLYIIRLMTARRAEGASA